MSEQNTLSIAVENDHQLPILYEVSLQGDVVGLQRLIRDDALALDRGFGVTPFNETPLHIAAMRGHSDFARELVTLKPQLAAELDTLYRTPLHWACEKGFTDIVIQLLQTNSDAALLPDHERRVPLQLAVMKGRNDVVLELVRSRPDSIKVKVEDGGTIMHLCVKCNNLEGLKLLAETAEGRELVKVSNDHGNNILHLAVIFKRVEITKYLLSHSIDIDKNAVNANGFTPLDTANHLSDSKALEMKILLLEAGVEKRIVSIQPSEAPEPNLRGCYRITKKCKIWWNRYMKSLEKRLEEARGNILVAATVTASMAFQAGINPPKFKKDFGSELSLSIADAFWLFNTLSLISSLLIILLMQSGIPFRNNKYTNIVAVIAMGLTVLSITAAYFHGVAKADSFEGDVLLLKGLSNVPLIVFYVIIILHVCTFLFYTFFKIVKLLKKVNCMLRS